LRTGACDCPDEDRAQEQNRSRTKPVAETRATVRSCIEQLSDNYRAVLMLRDIEELSTQEVDTISSQCAERCVNN
jgi:DNA-directed RNA polymerase specialized sigma24 family protein